MTEPLFDEFRTTAVAGDATKKRLFEEWQNKPEIKMLISLLPPLETDQARDCFTTVLRSAFDSGFIGGGEWMSMEFAKVLIADRNKRR